MEFCFKFVVVLTFYILDSHLKPYVRGAFLQFLDNMSVIHKIEHKMHIKCLKQPENLINLSINWLI